MIHRIVPAITFTAIALGVMGRGADDEARGAESPVSGALEGRVTFQGPPPAAVYVAESGGTQPVLHLDAGGGLQYAVVYLPDTPRSAAAPGAARTLDQRRFVFEPQVLAVRADQPVRFTNSDPASHNVRSTGPFPANAFSVNTAPGAATGHARRFTAPRDGKPVALSCDTHPWMQAWIYVFEHDQFAVTATGGHFVIDGVPAGRHRVAVRQPAGRLERDLAVDIRGGETTRLEVRFTGADVGMPSR